MFIFPSVDNFLNQNINKSTRPEIEALHWLLVIVVVVDRHIFREKFNFFPLQQPELARPCRKQTTQLFDDYDDPHEIM